MRLAHVEAGVYSLSLNENEKGKSVAFQKKIRREGRWESLTIFLTPQDVPCVRMLCQQMEERIVEINEEITEEPSTAQDVAAEGAQF